MMATLGDLLAGANRGLVSGTLGGPVDLANAAMGGVGGDQPVMGSQWIAAKLASLGLLPPASATPGATLGELAGSLASPGLGMAKGAMLMPLALSKSLKAQDASKLLDSGIVRALGVTPQHTGQDVVNALRAYLGNQGDAYLRALGYTIEQ